MADVVKKKLDVFKDGSLSLFIDPSILLSSSEESSLVDSAISSSLLSPPPPPPPPSSSSVPSPSNDADIDGVRVLSLPLHLDVLSGPFPVKLWLQPWLQSASKNEKVIQKPSFYGLQKMGGGYVMPFGECLTFDLFLFWKDPSKKTAALSSVPQSQCQEILNAIMPCTTSIMKEPSRSRFLETPLTMKTKKAKNFSPLAWKDFAAKFPDAWNTVKGSLSGTCVGSLEPRLLAVSFGGKELVHESTMIDDGLGLLKQSFSLDLAESVWIAIGIATR